MLTFYNLSKLGILTDQDMATPTPATPLGKVTAATSLSKVTSGVAAMTKRSSFKSLCRRLALVSTFILSVVILPLIFCFFIFTVFGSCDPK